MTESCSEKGRMTVFYDGACPLCSREIAFYRKLRGAEAIEWFDVSAVLEDKVAVDLPKQTACERFHVRGADGQLFAGGERSSISGQRCPPSSGSETSFNDNHSCGLQK